MKRFVEGADWSQSTFLPECPEDWIEEDNPVRAIDTFVDVLDRRPRVRRRSAGGDRPPAFHPSVVLKLYIYGYLNRVQSSRRLQREAGRNLELLWLLGRLVPDRKTIADFRKDNDPALRQVCARFVELCREMGLLATASVATDGSNDRDKNFTKGKIDRRRAQLEESVARYLAQFDTIDRQEPTEALAAKTKHLKENLASSRARWISCPRMSGRCCPHDSRSMATSGRGSGVVGYNVQVAVENESHLIVTHGVTTSDRSHLARVGKSTKAVMLTDKLDAVADHGYFHSPDI